MIDENATPNAEPKPESKPEPKPEPETKLVKIDEFFKLELKVAEIVEAERVEGADKLLRLQVDLGGERRQLVAGIALAYEPESLIGRKIIVVANLKPARIRGVESQGMLLAASAEGGHPVLATFTEPVPIGSQVR
jgi:methionyl-tRNA synthetase